MNTAKASLFNFRQSPRKMRLVANLVRSKKVTDVLVTLDFTDKKASVPIKTLIASALANAKSLDIPFENLIVKTITVNAGKTLMRRQPAARGSAHPIRKRTSWVFVELGEGKAKKTKFKKETEIVPTVVKKDSVKKEKVTKKATK